MLGNLLVTVELHWRPCQSFHEFRLSYIADSANHASEYLLCMHYSTPLLNKWSSLHRSMVPCNCEKITQIHWGSEMLTHVQLYSWERRLHDCVIPEKFFACKGQRRCYERKHTTNISRKTKLKTQRKLFGELFLAPALQNSSRFIKMFHPISFN